MNHRQHIEETIQTDFDCMYESNSDKAFKAFHPDAWITGYLPDGYQHMSVADFAAFVASQQPSPKENGEPARLDLISIDIAGKTAVARVSPNIS